MGWRINSSEDLPTLLHSAVTAVYDALLPDLGHTYDSYRPSRLIDRRQFAIPQTQWTAIAAAMTDRARAWGSRIELGLHLANLMPAAYECTSNTAGRNSGPLVTPAAG